MVLFVSLKTNGAHAATCDGVVLVLSRCGIAADLRKVVSTVSMLLEHQRFFLGTHKARTYLKGVLSMALNLFNPYFLCKLPHLSFLPSNYL